jgi:hypothetical protein
LVVLVVIAELMIHRAGPILKRRVTETLSSRFNGRVELDSLNVSVLRGLEVSGDRLRIYPPDIVVAAGAAQPLIALEHFSFHSGLMGLFVEPMHVGVVQATGLQINIAPREMRRQASEQPGKGTGKIKILVDKIVCDNSRLIIGTSKPDKDPKDFELKHIELRDVGPNAPWPCRSVDAAGSEQLELRLARTRKEEPPGDGDPSLSRTPGMRHQTDFEVGHRRSKALVSAPR